MKVFHLAMGRLSQNTSNGVNKIVHGLCKYMVREGHSIRVIGISTSSKEDKHMVQRDGFEVEVYNKFRGKCFDAIKEASQEADIVHLNSVWNKYNIQVANYLIKENIPYVITVHGGLFEDRVKQSRYYSKLLYNYFFQRKIFEKATGVQTNSLEESTAISRYISNSNSFVVPNGIDLEFPQMKDPSLWDRPKESRKDYIHCGYLGRLTVEKNVDGLIRAMAILPPEYRKKLKCYLIGPDKTDEAAMLKKKVKDLNLSEHIIFTGALYGDEKYERIRNLDFYIHPAFSEGFSIAVIEALFSETPCIITRTCNVSYYYNTGSFIMAEPFAEDLSRSIQLMIDKKAEWKSMGDKARNLVKNTMNWAVIAPQMIEAYQKLIDKN